MCDFEERSKNRIWSIFWMMYILFPFRIRGISFFQNVLYYGGSLLSIGLVLYKNQNRAYNKKYFREVVLYIVILAVLTLMTAMVPIIKNTNDYSYLSKYIYYWGRVFILFGVLILCRSVFQLIDLIIEATSLYVVFSIILLFPRLRAFYKSILLSSTLESVRAEELYSATYYTRFGLQGFSGFGASFTCTVAVMLCCYMIVESIMRRQTYRKYILFLIINNIGALFYGRIGIVVSLLLQLVTVCYLLVIYRRFKILASILVVLALAVFVFIQFSEQIRHNAALYWMFEGVYELLQSGRYETASTRRLQQMYVLPSINTFLWGDGYYMQYGAYYMRTDVGFLRPLLFGGILYELIYYGIMIPLFKVLRPALKRENGFFLLFLIFITTILFEMKGEELIDFSNILFLLVASILFYSRGQEDPMKESLI